MSLPAESPSERIGPYRVLYELGRGGMGVVYRAVREDGGPEVALKMPSREMSQLFGSVRREIHALGRLRHPGVVRILDEGLEQGVPWYAMELLEGQSLGKVLKLHAAAYEPTADLLAFAVQEDGTYPQVATPGKPRVRPDLTRALTLMYRLARTLAYLHSHGVVHRDLKPENVLVRAGDQPVLVDFGLVAHFHALTSREVLEVGGQATGTATYISPEQARGELVDARADLYSFGVMLYEIVADRPPFDANSVVDILKMHVSDPPVPPSERVRDVPPVLERLILNLLEKKRGARLGYAADVAKLLVEAGAEPDDLQIEATPYLYRPEIVGRRETIDAINQRVRATQQDSGAFVALGGVSGIGKTSVATVIAREATLSNVRVVTGESDPVGGAPLHPLRMLLRDIADQCRGRAEVTERVLGARLPVLRGLDPSLAALDETAQPIAQEIVSRRLFSDLAETLAAFAREHPLLLILDDLQWADEITLRFLASLGAEFFDGVPLVILGTYRADEAGPDLRALLASAHVTNVPLSRLDDDSVGEIVRSMLAAPDAPSSFLQFLAEQTEGNPFFIAEYLRSAVAEQLLYRESGRWHVAAADETYASLALPRTIRDLVAHRLARLSPLARRVAEAAAVLGRESSEEQFVAVSGESELDALDAVAELVEQHVFEPAEGGVRFAHDKLREAAYEHLEETRRRELHRRAAEWIEARDATRDAELARHCDAAGLHDKAIDYYARAAETAVGTGACREAIDFMNRAIALASGRERSSSGVPRSSSEFLGGRGASASEELRGTAEEPEEPRSRRERHAHWQRVLSFAQFGLGDLPASSEHARKSLGEVGIHLPRTPRGWQARLAREALLQATHFLLPRSLVRSRASKPMLRDVAMAAQKFSEGRYYTDEKIVMLASGLLAVNAAERLDDGAGLIHTYANFGAVTSGLGLNRVARRYYEKARQLAIAANDLNGLGHIGYTSAVLYITQCDWKSCARTFDDAVAAAKQTGDHQLIEMNLFARGFFELYRGRIAKAAQTFDDVRARAHKRLNRQHEAWGHSWRAGCLILRDHGEEALDAIQAALDLVAPLSDNAKLVSYAHRCHALLHLGRLDEAIEAADVTYAAVAKIPAIIWEKYRGLSAPAEVYLQALTQSATRSIDVEKMRRATDVLLRRLELASRHMPLSLPVTLRLQGMREYLEGHPKRGEKLLRKSIAAAVRLGLPIEEGIGEYTLARHSTAQRAHLDRARAILQETGCALYLKKIDAVEGA